MTLLEIALLLLLGSIGAVAIAPKLKIPNELILLSGSLALSLIPGLPNIQLQPDLVFSVFLPPILFAAAYFTSWRDFKRNIRPISLLAVGLVVFTTSAVAIVLKLLVPSVAWSTAFLLGAVVSPPDASAAVAITKKLGVPRRLQTIIEGESLINDATALVCFRFALAAAATGAFSPWQASGKLIWVGGVGIAVGVAVAYAAMQLLKRVKDPHAETVLSFVTCFACYLIAEHLGASGVISTVAGGLYFGRELPQSGSAQTRVVAEAVWGAVLLIINGFVFTLIGLQLPQIFQALNAYGWVELLILASVISLTVIVVRFLWVFPATHVPRWLFKSIRRHDPAPSWQALVVLSWTAMRGIVSLAAVLSIPELTADGRPFPHRELVVFLAYAVILVTLILPATTLPFLLPRLGIRAGDEHLQEETMARLESAKAALQALERMKAEGRYPVTLLDFFKGRVERRLKAIETSLEPAAFSSLLGEEIIQRRLLREMIDAERKALVDLRTHDKIHDEVFHLINRELDVEDLRLKTQRI